MSLTSCSSSKALSGRVVDAKDRENKIAGVQIYFAKAGTTEKIDSCYTDSLAQFTFDKAKTAKAKKKDFYEIGYYTADGASAISKRGVLGKELRAGMPKEQPFYFEIDPGAVISGQICDSISGEPLEAGGWVYAWSGPVVGEADAVATAQVRDDGTFAINILSYDLLPGENSIGLKIRCPGHASLVAQDMRVKRGMKLKIPNEYLRLRPLSTVNADPNAREEIVKINFGSLSPEIYR